jgi:hypothetical protein
MLYVMSAILEIIFDICYLAIVITLGILMVKGSAGRKQYLLFGTMALTLGCGDAFHLVPRVLALCTTGLAAWAPVLGIGKLVTSITMTIFYVLLYYVWRARYQVQGKRGLTSVVWILSVARVLLCLMPQNEWTSATPPLSWGICRNIPFAALGVIVIILFFRSARKMGDRPFRWLWLTVVLSFAFYIPVVLFADSYPAIGLLMLPKTCAYLWTVAIGYCAMRGEKA